MNFSKFALLLCLLASSFVAHSQVRPSLDKSTQIVGKEKHSEPFLDGKTVVAEVEYSGLDVYDQDYVFFIENAVYKTDFITKLKDNRTNISADDMFSSEKIEKVLKMLKEWLAYRGYPTAEVAVYGTKLPKNRMRLRFSVERGPFVRVTEVSFVGNKSISSDEFVEDFKKCTGDRWKNYDPRAFQYFTQKCSRQLMFSKGFFRAKVHGVTSRLFANGRHVKVEVEEGIRYRLGEIGIEGEKAFTKKEILDMMGQKSGDVADGRGLQNFIYDSLKREYGEKGYVLYNAEFEPEFVEPEAEGLDGLVNLQIIIDEGKKFTIRRIIFTGVDGNEERSLKEDFTLKEGELFVPSKLESWADKINKTERFYFLDKDQHVEIRTDEEKGDLDLVILLKKYKP